MKYYIGDTTVIAYCKENNISYGSVLKRIRKGESVYDAVKDRDKHIKSRYNARKIFIGGVPLREYCDMAGINYTTERKKIRYKKNLSCK